jgi:hypothetical protein
MNTYEKLILYTSYVLYGLFFLAILGVERETTLNMAMQVEGVYKFTIGVMLVAFANPYADLPKAFLKKLAFAAGVFIVMSSGVTELLVRKVSGGLRSTRLQSISSDGSASS